MKDVGKGFIKQLGNVVLKTNEKMTIKAAGQRPLRDSMNG